MSTATDNELLLKVGSLQVDLAAVAKQRDALKRLVDEATAKQDKLNATIDRVKHGGLHSLLMLAHDDNELTRLLNAGDCNTEAADAAVAMLGTSDHYEAERILQRWITGE